MKKVTHRTVKFAVFHVKWGGQSNFISKLEDLLAAVFLKTCWVTEFGDFASWKHDFEAGIYNYVLANVGQIREQKMCILCGGKKGVL